MCAVSSILILFSFITCRGNCGCVARVWWGMLRVCALSQENAATQQKRNDARNRSDASIPCVAPWGFQPQQLTALQHLTKHTHTTHIQHKWVICLNNLEPLLTPSSLNVWRLLGLRLLGTCFSSLSLSFSFLLYTLTFLSSCYPLFIFISVLCIHNFM